MNSRTGFEFRSVSKSFGGKRVLKDVSLALPDGQHTALIGASGCGKSTLLRLLAGLDAPDAGEILLDGSVISTANKILVPPHQRGVSMVFQDLALWPNLSAMENVLLGIGTSNASAQGNERAVDTLRLCRIESLRDRRPGTLSGGEQQRVALARAIVGNPRFLFLDEPFSGLDLVTKTAFFSVIAGLVSETRLTLILVTHDLFEAIALSDSVVVFDQGTAGEAGELHTFIRESRLPVAKLFRDQLGRLGTE